ncbi:flavin reductase (DIM6/NTAB) family NADH-FMN oxidoreductase RutF [Kineococcus xinjiangensis]|uniref:Flavin reductase (DIM6/NTAB) family NADH-FMN oxidoreductase RutF n=1 Tax=Kineococcus xinjiangensis TaxID=512762 RepID=A0A2S6IK83_9ACTN|nr:flavin reductase family protein [Kineococcus xinjiangensis]PPK94608.1 flavin reductase (DIM6/NTAB) family NADH-FMN oxidoreductase RutF [Kineococcus xinjiangensis]
MDPDSETPGGHIHSGHPFLRPEALRDPARRLRGRLPAPVTLWTAAHGGERAGLTVSSVLVAEPGELVGVVGDETDVLDVLQRSGAFAVTVLDWSHRGLADAFSFLAPAPGGPFTVADWEETAWGPVPAGDVTWAGCRVRGVRELGYGRLVEAGVEHVHLAEERAGAAASGGRDPLAWHRGRYRHLD